MEIEGLWGIFIVSYDLCVGQVLTWISYNFLEKELKSPALLVFLAHLINSVS